MFRKFDPRGKAGGLIPCVDIVPQLRLVGQKSSRPISSSEALQWPTENRLYTLRGIELASGP